MRAIVALALLAACGTAPRARPAPPPPAEPIAQVAGAWTWSHVSERDGTRIIERERWQLDQRGADVTGHCDREIVFLSMTGTPFRCSQSPSYALRSRFAVRGRVSADGGELVETELVTEPGPCEPGSRELARYQLTVTAGGLELHWPGGSQTLARASAAPAHASAPSPSLTGTYAWSTRRADARDPRLTRVERERWTLRERAGQLDGEYDRSVTVFAEAGTIHACNGQPSYTIRARYRVRGERVGDRVSLVELAAVPEPSPCDERGDRHLDAAHGVIHGSALELRWRGDRRQVLHLEPAATTR